MKYKSFIIYIHIYKLKTKYKIIEIFIIFLTIFTIFPYYFYTFYYFSDFKKKSIQFWFLNFKFLRKLGSKKRVVTTIHQQSLWCNEK